MVKQNFFARLGIVQFVRGWLRRRRFISAFDECEQLSWSGKGRHIVVCFNGEPLIINKRQFKKMRRDGVFIQTSTWGTLCRWQVTRQNLNDFFTTKTTKQCF